MKHMLTENLTGAALDWAVAVLQNVECDEQHSGIWFNDAGEAVRYTPSTDWSQAGPIIERNRIDVVADEHTDEWHSVMCGEVVHIAMGYGPTPIIAALRCYVASKFGDYIDLPKELENLP